MRIAANWAAIAARVQCAFRPLGLGSTQTREPPGAAGSRREPPGAAGSAGSAGSAERTGLRAERAGLRADVRPGVAERLAVGGHASDREDGGAALGHQGEQALAADPEFGGVEFGGLR